MNYAFRLKDMNFWSFCVELSLLYVFFIFEIKDGLD
jgi:hypothetical protein